MSHFANHSEENYLKTLYKLGNSDVKKLNNITLSKALKLNPATVLEMVRKLGEKKLVQIQADKSINLTEKGKKKALLIIRRHRLWEVFLVDKLKYKWNEVHELAEQLEHIASEDLIERLNVYLNKPSYDPHGDPIPDKSGKIIINHSIPLSSILPGKKCEVASLAETSDSFLDYLNKIFIKPGTKLKVVEKNEYDHSFTIAIQKKMIQISEKVANNILVQPTATSANN